MTMTTTALVPRVDHLPVPVDSLDSYIQAVNRVPMLSGEEERELAQRLRLHDDLAAAQRLIVAHLRFVVHVARSYVGYGLPLGERGRVEFAPDHAARAGRNRRDDRGECDSRDVEVDEGRVGGGTAWTHRPAGPPPPSRTFRQRGFEFGPKLGRVAAGEPIGFEGDAA